MNGMPLACNLPIGGMDDTAQIELLHAAGFEGIFPGWGGRGSLDAPVKAARERGMLISMVHAPFGRAADLWKGGEAAETALAEQIACLEDTAAASVPVMVTHAFIGFEDHSPNDAGVECFLRLARRAEELGVTVAVENTEGEEYLDAVLAHCAEYPSLRFCLDTGHALCYNRGRDFFPQYGRYLAATHLNDNLGVRDAGGVITWHDDLHLLPFDGIADWDAVASGVVSSGFSGPLTFELTTGSKPGRHDNDAYAVMPPEIYIAAAYARACRVAAKAIRARRSGV